MGAAQVGGRIGVSLFGTDAPFYTSVNTGATYTEESFGFTAIRIVVVNDSSNDVDFSFDGATLEGTVKKGETHEFAGKHTSIHHKSSAGSDAIRIWAF